MERMDGRTRRTGAGGRMRTEGEGRSGRERTSDAFSRADGRRGRVREEGTTASGGAAPALPARGRKRAPPTAAAAGRPQWRSITE